MTVKELLGDWYNQNERIWRRIMQMEGYVRCLSEDEAAQLPFNKIFSPRLPKTKMPSS
jgi:hypothetical protein